MNPPDRVGVTGVPYIARPTVGLRNPRNGVRGSDVAEVVEAAGKNVMRLQPGDEVFGADEATFAEYAVVAEKNLAPKRRRRCSLPASDARAE